MALPDEGFTLGDASDQEAVCSRAAKKRPQQQTAGGGHHSGPSRYPNAMLSVRLATCLAYFR